MPRRSEVDRYAEQFERGEGYVFPRSRAPLKDDMACKTVDVSDALKAYKKEHKLTYKSLAQELEMDDSYLHRLVWPPRKDAWSREIVSLTVVDRIFTRLGLPLPPVYARAWVRVEEDL